MNTTYLTPEELKENYTPISANVDVSQLESFISVAEDTYIFNHLGLALDTELKYQIENSSLSGDNLILVEYIKPASAWYTFYQASTFIRSKAMNRGITQQFSDNSQVIPYEDFRQYRQSILDNAVFYLNKLIDYLQDNKELYPLWRCSSENPISIKKGNSSGIYL